jgi:hypothetical protein
MGMVVQAWRVGLEVRSDYGGRDEAQGYWEVEGGRVCGREDGGRVGEGPEKIE